MLLSDELELLIENENSDGLTNNTKFITLSNGLECVQTHYKYSNKGFAGLSCNWDKHNKKKAKEVALQKLIESSKFESC